MNVLGFSPLNQNSSQEFNGVTIENLTVTNSLSIPTNTLQVSDTQNLQSILDNLQVQITENDVSLTDVISDISDNVDSILEIITDVNGNIISIQENTARITNTISDVSLVKLDVIDNANTIASNSAGIVNLISDVSLVKLDVASNATNIATKQDQLTTTDDIDINELKGRQLNIVKTSNPSISYVTIDNTGLTTFNDQGGLQKILLDNAFGDITASRFITGDISPNLSAGTNISLSTTSGVTTINSTVDITGKQDTLTTSSNISTRSIVNGSTHGFPILSDGKILTTDIQVVNDIYCQDDILADADIFGKSVLCKIFNVYENYTTGGSNPPVSGNSFYIDYDDIGIGVETPVAYPSFLNFSATFSDYNLFNMLYLHNNTTANKALRKIEFFSDISGSITVENQITGDISPNLSAGTNITLSTTNGVTTINSTGGGGGGGNFTAGNNIDIDSNNVISLETPLVVDSDTDTTHTLGRAKIGYNGLSTDAACFGHFNYMTGTGYAIKANSSGKTTVNSAGTQDTIFTTNNSLQMKLVGSSGNLELTNGDLDIQSGTISIQPDTDNVVAVLGRAKIGYNQTNVNTASFAHFDNMSGTNYALRQNQAGKTSINAVTGQDIIFCIDNSTKMTLNSTGYLGIGNTNPSFPLVVFPNSNNLAHIGYAKIGYMGSNNEAGFAHTDNMTTTRYAIKQNISGGTQINSRTGQDIQFKINNSTKASVNSSGHFVVNNRLQVGGYITSNGNGYLNWLQGGGQTNHFWRFGWDSSRYSRVYFRNLSGDNRVSVFANSFDDGSDDRVKADEEMIDNALTTIMKLKPQTYNKHGNFNCNDTDVKKESGLIAQDIYYDTPELRHIVTLPENVNESDILPRPEETNIQQDPDYTSLGWGNDTAYLNYKQFIPWLIKGMQEQQTIINKMDTEIENLKTERITILDRLEVLEGMIL